MGQGANQKIEVTIFGGLLYLNTSKSWPKIPFRAVFFFFLFLVKHKQTNKIKQISDQLTGQTSTHALGFIMSFAACEQLAQTYSLLLLGGLEDLTGLEDLG